jgi:biotin carboxylase
VTSVYTSGMQKILITGAGGSAATNVIESLKLANSHISIIACDSSRYMLNLSKGDERYLLPHSSEDSYLQSLINRIDASNPDAIFAQPDQEVKIIVSNIDEINTGKFFPDKEVIEICGDKNTLNTVLQRAGVPTPEATDLTSGDFKEQINDFIELHGKSWVRARRGAGSRASLPVSTSAQCINWISWWAEEKKMNIDDFMVSEFLPGREFAFQAIFQDGRLIAGEARERVEYLFGFLTPSGQSSSPSVAKTTKDKRIYEAGINAIKAVSKNPHGVFGVDIKENKYGIPCVTEINAGRFYTTSFFFARAGVNMPDMALRAARGERLQERGVAILEEGLTWIRMMDMGYCLQNQEGDVLWRSN